MDWPRDVLSGVAQEKASDVRIDGIARLTSADSETDGEFCILAMDNGAHSSVD